MQLAIEYRQIDSLAPYVNNARTHSAGQIEQLAGSIKEFGFTNPILVDGTNGIIAGHGRILAARSLGMDSVPCVELARLTDVQKRAYILADNKLALNAGWDAELLSLELKELDAEGFDMGLIGFSDEEMAALTDQTEGLTDPDAVPETPANPISVLGDVWILGKHRIICGDSCSADDVGKVLGDVKPMLMVTDPPYGVEYDPEWRAKSGLNKNKDKMGAVKNDDRADWTEAWALFPGDVAYVWHSGVHFAVVHQSLENCDLQVRCQVIWAKDRFAMSRGHYHWQHEPCWYAVRKGGTGHWSGDRSQTTLWSIKSRDDSGHGHSTQKPVECMRRPIENNSSPGQAVYEPFSGSGTTIIAAEQTARSCYAIEISPAYVDVAVIRWQEFTGQEAVHADTGKTFKEMQEEKNGRSLPT